MRKSTIFTVFLLFSVMLLVLQIPGALAQEVPCLISGKDRLPVAMSEGGSCDADVLTYFTASFNLNTNLLTLTGQGIVPSCNPGQSLQYELLQDGNIITLTEVPVAGYHYLFRAQLTRRSESGGFNHLSASVTPPQNFGSATADLVGDSIEGSVNTSPVVRFSSQLEGCTDKNGQNYVVMSNPIPNSAGPAIDGPSFFMSCSPETSAPISKVYIPVNPDWSLSLTCGQRIFVPVLRDNNHAVPAFTTYGLLLFCLSIFGLGIWAMRKTRFGNTLAGL
jgi:hypothetical protein